MSGSTAPVAKFSAAIPIPSQQVLKRIEVVELKGLRDLQLDIAPAGLTAIMGANCSGKTTVLHALACCYRPLLASDPAYRFPMFFKPNSDALWKGSDFKVIVDYRQGTTTYSALSVRFTKQADRWGPRSEKRPERSVRFMTIRDSVPDLEAINLNAMVHYTRSARTDDTSEQIMKAAGVVLNRTYTTYDDVQYRYLGKRSIGVTLNGLKYAGVAMSSGEQRVFKIIDTVFKAPKYALILVDELDLFLHQEALERLIDVMIDHCAKHNKQLVFTTHFPAIADLYDKVNIATIHRVAERTLVWKGYSHEALRYITGKQQRPISVYVEDDVAQAIVSKIGADMGIRKFMEVGRYGPAVNAFSLGTGLILSKAPTDHCLLVLDGDVFGAEAERRVQVGRMMTGTAPEHDVQRETLMSLVKSFLPVDGLAPEQMLHRMLHSVGTTGLGPEDAALLHIAHGIQSVPEKHGYINAIIVDSGESREVALNHLVRLAATSSDWARYTAIVHDWLVEQKAELGL